MGKIFFYVAFLMIAIGCAKAEPKMFIEGGDTYDWGTVAPGKDPLKADVKIYNKGNDTLVIKEVRPGCGCTGTTIDKKSIEPNGFATLNISFNLASIEGEAKKGIKIFSNDPTHPELTYSIKANVFIPLRVMPRFINFNNLKIGEETVAGTSLVNNTDKDLKITQLSIVPATVTLNLKEGDILKANGEFKLLAKFTPKVQENVSGKIRIKTNNPDLQELIISVWGNYYAPVEEKK